MKKTYYPSLNTLKYWTPEGFEISSYKWNLSEKVNQSYDTSGSDKTKLCTYTYNELGFRGDSVSKEGFKIMSIGDSNTEGVGVNNDETWPAQFSKLIPNGVNHNFGMGGRSNDYISRCLITYYDFIKPDLVLIMYTSPQRRELYTKDGGLEPFMITSQWGYTEETEEGREVQQSLTTIQNDYADFMNWYKNHLLIKYFLESKKCNWLWNGWYEVPLIYEEFNRFDGLYGKFVDDAVDFIHPGPLHNKIYAKNLMDHIYTNFRSYVPNNLI
jgi:hypothetical protein